MPEKIQRILEPSSGDRSSILRMFLWQLDDQSRRLAEDTRGATVEELAWQPAPGMNTAGMLLAHIAIVEVGWVRSGVHGQEWDTGEALPIRREDDGIPLPPGGAPPAALRGRDLAFFDDLLARAREHTRQAIAPLTDADLGRRFRITYGQGKEVEATVAWVLYHVLEHLAGHYGQVNLLRHQYRAARERG